MSIDEMITVLEAAKEGKRIQYWHDSPEPPSFGRWEDIGLCYTAYDFYRRQYRVAPKPREIWADPISKNTTHYAYNSKAEFIAACSDGRYECNPCLFREVMEVEK